MDETYPRCPVCGKIADEFGHRHEDNILHEEWMHCGRCGYRFTYGFGIYNAEVSGRLFAWDWLDDRHNAEEEREFRDAVSRAKLEWESRDNQ